MTICEERGNWGPRWINWRATWSCPVRLAREERGSMEKVSFGLPRPGRSPAYHFDSGFTRYDRDGILFWWFLQVEAALQNRLPQFQSRLLFHKSFCYSSNCNFITFTCLKTYNPWIVLMVLRTVIFILFFILIWMLCSIFKKTFSWAKMMLCGLIQSRWFVDYFATGLTYSFYRHLHLISLQFNKLLFL